MRLYATVTSERASKGQGGNEYINIDLMRGSASDSIKCYRLHFTEKALSILKNDKVIFQELVEKGEKQKGEKNCSHCGSEFGSQAHKSFACDTRWPR